MMGLSFAKIDVDASFDSREAFFEQMAKHNKGYPRRVPQVYHKGRFVGGYKALTVHLEKQADTLDDIGDDF